MSHSISTQATSSGSANNVNTSQVLLEAQSDANLAAVGGVPSENISTSTQINTLEDLKRLSPKLYDQIVQSIAQNMMIDFRNREDRLEKQMKQMQNDQS